MSMTFCHNYCLLCFNAMLKRNKKPNVGQISTGVGGHKQLSGRHGPPSPTAETAVLTKLGFSSLSWEVL